MLTLLALMPARNGRGDDLGEALMALVDRTRQEPGNITYNVHRSNNDPQLWMMYEHWTSQEALDAHFEQPYMKDLVSRLPVLLEGELKLQMFTQTSKNGA